MGHILKTGIVSEQLSVNPTTVQRWIKYFNIQCDTNDHGHYLIAPKQLELLQKIKKQLNQGLTMKEIRELDETVQSNRSISNNKKEKMLPVHVFEEKLEQLMFHIEQLERKLAVKADEVVGYQVLQQRADIDHMCSTLSSIEERMSLLEQQQQSSRPEEQAVGDLEIVSEQFKKRRRKKLKNIFSF
ncbi:chromosome-anchoring protein RacA [Bacillaceae bacterium IKA-2]|nr:chromosome-anchoring protein RacA [Bacillaceae bacterium IKA-2]